MIHLYKGVHVMAKQKIELNSEIVKEYGIDAGANVVGIAASKDFSSAPEGFKPSDNLEECASVIVLGAASPDPKEVLANPEIYTANRNAMLTAMTETAKKVAKRIKADGYKAVAISAIGSKTVNGKSCGHISLKHAAELAGLGLITKNYLLTNPQYGNMLWLSAVLTDANLTPDKKLKSNICKSCGKCVKECPEKALDDLASFKRKECSKYFVIENRKLLIKCYQCRKTCPHCLGISS